MSSPGWLRAVQHARMGDSLVRPAAIRWDPAPVFPHRGAPDSRYRSDPFTYLQYAREMRSFYAAHRREPLFPFATKVSLWLLRDQDVAISFASAAFSVLAIAAVYLLGAAAFSPLVGLGAALLMAVEYDVVTTSIEGWRDDAFTCAVLLTALAMLRYMRDPTRPHAVALGLVGGAACLVRITSLSFIIPGLVFLAFDVGRKWDRRLPRFGLAIGVLALTVGPFLFNCWRAFGDPFYAINVHADVYRAAEGDVEKSPSAREYLAAHFRREPVRTIDTIAIGLTRYPFANKWQGFERWLPSVGAGLSWLAIAGLLMFTATPAGRLLLVVLVGSLVPYAATWQLIADWRFTQHAYPFFLLAACSAVVVPAMEARRILRVRRGQEWKPSRRATLGAIAVVAIAAAGWFLIARVLPVFVFEEALKSGESATIRAGDRDTAFLGEWPRVVTTGAVTTRVAAGPRASVRVPMQAGVEYEGTARIDPATEPLKPGVAVSPIQVLLNGRMVAACETGSTPERIGACRFILPADATRAGTNRLTFAASLPGTSDGFRLWYLRLQRKPAAK